MAEGGGRQHGAAEAKDIQAGKASRRSPQEAGKEGRGELAKAEDWPSTAQAQGAEARGRERPGLPQATACGEAPRGQFVDWRRRKRLRGWPRRHGSWGDDEEEPPSGGGASSRDGRAPASPELLPSRLGSTPALVHRQVNGGDCCWRALAAAIADAEGREGYCYRPRVEGPIPARPCLERGQG